MPGEYRKRELIDDVLVVTHVVDNQHDGWRVDNYLRKLYKHYSRARIQRFIEEGRIAMHGKKLKPSTTIRPGDRVHLSTKMSPAQEPEVNLQYKVLFEDEHLLVVDKPGNLPVHPAGRFFFNTLLMALRQDRQDWTATGNDFYLVHRLDRETSGVIVLGKTSEAASKLWHQFSKRNTEKRYYAVVHGHCTEKTFSVEADLGSDKSSAIRLKMAAFPKGQGEMEALTHFEVLLASENFTLLDCKLETGRQHQIRVHIAHAGHPIVGDKLYGGDETIFLDHIGTKAIDPMRRQTLLLDRHALHSRYLRFYHDLAGRWIEVESSLPSDIQKLLDSDRMKEAPSS